MRKFLPLFFCILLAACAQVSTPPAEQPTPSSARGVQRSSVEAMKKESAMMKKEEGVMMKKESQNTEKPEAMEKSSALTSRKTEAPGHSSASPARGQYVEYRGGVLADGQTKVLFFHAKWCPVCKAADAKLQAWYAADGFPLSVYKVDYDTTADLKANYGVTYQHTFVKVDGRGNMIAKIQGPGDEELRGFLRK